MLRCDILPHNFFGLVPLMTSSSTHDAQRADDQGKEAWRHLWECAVGTYIENYISRQLTIYIMAKVVTSPLTLHFITAFPSLLCFHLIGLWYFCMGELELEILCSSVVKRDSLTQPQSHRGTEAIFSAWTHPHDSAMSQKIRNVQKSAVQSRLIVPH